MSNYLEGRFSCSFVRVAVFFRDIAVSLKKSFDLFLLHFASYLGKIIKVLSKKKKELPESEVEINRKKKKIELKKIFGYGRTQFDKGNKNPDSLILGNHVINFIVNNINGNSNDVTLPSAEITVSEGSLEDLNENSIFKIFDTISHLPNEQLSRMPNITIPIYILNVNSILLNGNKNTGSIG